MTLSTDFPDRLAARILGVDVEARADEVRRAFRDRVRAVHPDTSVAEGCVDIGRLAEAKDRLVARARRRDESRPATPRAGTTSATVFEPFDYTRGFEVIDRRGTTVDLAG